MSWSGNQEQDDVDGAGEVENRDDEKCNRGRYVVVAKLHTTCYGKREDDEGVRQWVT